MDFGGLASAVLGAYGTEIVYANHTVTAVVDGGERVDALQPGARLRAWVRVADLAEHGITPRKGDAVVVAGEQYRVLDVLRDPDDVGGLFLALAYVRT